MSDFYSDQNGNGLRTTGPLGGQISSANPAMGTLGEQLCAGVNHHDNMITAGEKVRQYRETLMQITPKETYIPPNETIGSVLQKQDKAVYEIVKKADADKHLDEIATAIYSGNSKWLNDHASLHHDFEPDQIAVVVLAAVMGGFEIFKIIYDKGFRCGASLSVIVGMAFDLDNFEILDVLDKDGEDIKSIHPQSHQGLLLWRKERSSTESI